MIEHFTVQEYDQGDRRVVHWVLKPESASDAAEALANAIVVEQTEGVPHLHQVWKARRAGGPDLTENQSRALEILIRVAVGLPGSPKNPDHLEALVAEHLWYQLRAETGDQLAEQDLLEAPSFRVTDHGGDGLALLRSPEGDRLFRLWEIKKRSPAGDLMPTVKRASEQLDTRGAEYLAEYSKILQKRSVDTDTKLFAAQMMELWLDAAPPANAGIAVGTAEGAFDDRCFSPMPTILGRFRGATDRLAGFVVETNDYAGFAIQVREEIWKGL